MSEQQPEAPVVPGVARERIIAALGAVYGRSPRYNPETRRYDREPDAAEIADSTMSVVFRAEDGHNSIRGATIAEVADVISEALALPEPLIMPADEFAAVRTVWAAMAPWTPEQIAEFKVRIEAAMANPGPLRVLPSDRWKDRAEAAEAKLAAAESRAGEMEERYDRVTLSLRDLEAAEAKLAEVRAVLLEGGQDDGTVRRRALAIIGTDEEAAFARQLVAQAKAADAEYKVAAVRAAVYTFLHQHGRSALPAFKVAIDLAVSLRKIIDDLGGEEEPGDGA